MGLTMRGRVARIFVALLIAMMSCSNPASATEFPEVGSRFRCDAGARPHININGWQCEGGGSYSKNGKEGCCIDIFSPFTNKIPSGRTRWNPDRMMLVRTRGITRTSAGGIDIEEIVEAIIVERNNTEEFMQESSDCSMNGQDTFRLSVVDKKKKTIVGITWDGAQFKQMFFNWRVFPCADDD
jgi:hypothetical protein